MCGCYVTGDKCWWCCCETMMVLEMRSVPMRQTDGCLLCEEMSGFCVCNKVKISKCITVKSGTGFL